jgi:putative SOS response-associated peptidase YedK
LVPATAFCEPDEGKPARWHWFALKADEPRPLLAFASTGNGKGRPNVDIEVFSFMTTLPNTLTSTINQERSPVLLTSEEECRIWLTGTPEEALGAIKTSDPERMHIVQSGFDKEDLLAACVGEREMLGQGGEGDCLIEAGRVEQTGNNALTELEAWKA